MSAKTFAAALLLAAAPLGAAHAQYASPPPLYPYMVQNGYGVQTPQPYAIQVAPNTYVIQRPGWQHEPSTVRPRKRAAAPAPGRFDRAHKPVDHALVDELRKRVQKKSDAQASAEQGQKSTVNTTRIVRHAPVVRETTRIVDDPPRVIDQVTIDNSDDTPKRGLLNQPRRSPPAETGSVELPAPAPAPDGGGRTIRAEAEVTILGPDRMTIRLFRKGQGPFAKAKKSE